MAAASNHRPRPFASVVRLRSDRERERVVRVDRTRSGCSDADDRQPGHQHRERRRPPSHEPIISRDTHKSMQAARRRLRDCRRLGARTVLVPSPTPTHPGKNFRVPDEHAQRCAGFVTILRNRRAAAPRAGATRRGRRDPARRARRPPPTRPAADRPAPIPRPRHPARPPRPATRATTSCNSTASGSSTFMLTCTIPRLGSARPSARTPGKPPPRSRTTAAIARATSTSSVARFTLNATSGRRAPTSTAPAARIEPCRPEVGGSSPASMRRCNSAGPPRRKNAGPRAAASSP